MRRPRILVDGARYHITARANRKEMILESDSMKALFVDVLERAKKRFAFAIENFCIMGNHIHLILRPHDGVNLSRLMQWIMSVFAMAWNKIHGLTGHVWGERFFSRVLADFSAYTKAFRYVSENAVDAGLVAAGLLWPFSGPGFWRAGLRHFLEPPKEFTFLEV